jgi:hypothetical protein
MGTFDGGADDGENYLNAQTAAGQIVGALTAVTDAEIAKEWVVIVNQESNVIPADAEINEEALIAVHLNAPSEAEKLANVRIPAPIAAMFQTDALTVDLTNANLVQYIQQLAQHSTVSDGEQIDTTTGTDGMKHGYWRSKAKTG